MWENAAAFHMFLSGFQLSVKDLPSVLINEKLYLYLSEKTNSGDDKFLHHFSKLCPWFFPPCCFFDWLHSEVV